MSRTLGIRVFGGMLLLAGAWAAYTQNQAPPQLTLNQVKDDLYEIVGDGGNVAVYITNEGVILVDDKYEQDYEQIMAKVKSVTNQPVKYILSTHHHADHSGGNVKFLPTVEIISTANARANIVQKKQSNAPANITPARVTFTDETAIHLGGKEVRARYCGRGHTNGDAVIYFPLLKTLHTGDLMSGNTPLIDYPGGGSVVEWTKTLDEAMKLDFDTVIPGHGAVTNKAGLLAYRNNVEKLRNRATGLIREGKSQDEVAKVMTAEFNWAANSLQMQWSMPGMMAELEVNHVNKRMTRYVVWAAVASLAHAQSPIDRDMLAKIRSEALDHSQVAPVFDTFTVSIGPRLTASPAQKRASQWARDRLESYGLENARLEPWKFGRGWTLEKLTVEMIEPRYLPLIGYADAWSASTDGEILASPVWIGGKSPAEVEGLRAGLKGAIVMTDPIMTNFVRKDRPQPSEPNYEPNSAAYATSLGRGGAGGRNGTAGRGGAPTNAQQIAQTLRAAGAGAILKPSRGEHGTVFVTGRDGGAGAVPTVTLSAEHYNMIALMLKQNIPVKLRVNVQTKYYDADGGNAYNVIAELPGVDPALRDEVVMIGGHLDCWHTGVGATDNADGSATVMEAMRILKAVGARPRRTIRVALWSGEEQGMLGSRAWVAQHLAGDSNTVARGKFDVYFNIDNGTGPIYGWYLQNSEQARPMFDAWLDPLKSFGARRNTIEPVGSTDHLSFLEAGVPGFNPIQEYAGYDIRTHHTNMDTVDRVDVNEIRQAAAVMAWFAYNSAMADAKIPRPR